MYNERLYKSRGLDDKLNTTFGFLRENLKTIFRTLAIVSVPFCLVGAFILTSKSIRYQIPQEGFEWLKTTTEMGTKSDWLLYVAVSLLVLTAMPLLFTIVDESYADRHHSMPTTAKHVFSKLWGNQIKCLSMPFCQIALIIILILIFRGKVGGNIGWMFILIYVFIATSFILPKYILQKQNYGSSLGNGLAIGHRYFFQTLIYVVVTIAFCFFFYWCGNILMSLVNQLKSVLIGGSVTEHPAVYGVYWVMLFFINYLICFGFSIAVSILSIAICYQLGDIEDNDKHIILKERIGNFENLKDV